MKKTKIEFFPPSLYNFLRFIGTDPTEKMILDCGAGGPSPKLALFKKYGFDVYGIEISDESLKMTEEYSWENKVNLNIKKGDMRNIPFQDEMFDYIYSYNSIFHLNKADSGIAIKEMYRVLKKGGLLFLNFLSIEDPLYGQGKELNPGEFLQQEGENEVIHTFYEDSEPDDYFNDFKILFKIKKKILKIDSEYFPCYLEYIAEK